MVDVVRLLNVPLPWDSHGSAKQLPERYHALLEFEATTAAKYFVTTGPLAPATGQIRVIPGLDIDETGVIYKRCMLHATTMDDICAAIEHAALSDQPQRLIISGSVKWNQVLRIENSKLMILDFSALWIDVTHCGIPLVLLHKSHKVQIRGLKVTQAHEISIDVIKCTDIVISHVAFSGIFGAGIRISGGSKRILVDCSIFVHNGGNAVKIVGEVQNVVIVQSQFFGPTSTPFIDVSEAVVAEGYAALNADEAGRDALITAQPSNIKFNSIANSLRLQSIALVE